LTKRTTAHAAALSLLVFALASGGCGGGSSSAGAGSPPPSGGSPPSSPPSSLTGVQPKLYVERDADGTAYLRVEEEAVDVLGAAVQRVIADQVMGPAPGSNTVIEGAAPTRIANVDAVQMKYGLTMQASAQVEIYDYTYRQFDGGGSIFGAAMKLGDNDRPTNGSTYIQRVVADGMQQADSSYKVSNTDFLGVEEDSGPIYMRDVTGRNFGDAGVDTKSNQVYIMNATLSGVHRGLRAWPGVEIIVVNSIINPAAGHSQGWVYDGTSTIRYYNTLWCENSANPSKDDPSCSANPRLMEGETINASVAQARFIPLSSNPLPGVSPFFRTQIDEVYAEYSSNGGQSWTKLAIANAGGPGTPPVGDTRYKIPLNLNAGDYLFRVQYKKDGAAVGSASQAVDEAGAPR
jgi:hypothetical protein